MILIADSGSTKTEWRLVENDARISLFTDGLNPYYTSITEMVQIISAAFTKHQKEKVTNVYFYGAGCIGEEKCRSVKEAVLPVFPGAVISVETDILGAARALFGKSAGIAAISGTGSGSCLYDGNQIIQSIPSLGYILGDEGSGSYLGKKLLKAMLRKELPEDLILEFNTKYNLSYTEILDCIYKKPFPNRWLAQFSIFIKEHEVHPSLQKMLSDSFTAFFENQLCKYHGFSDYPVGFTGSVAYNFSEIILTIAGMKQTRVKSIIKSPVDGLVMFHAQS